MHFFWSEPERRQLNEPNRQNPNDNGGKQKLFRSKPTLALSSSTQAIT